MRRTVLAALVAFFLGGFTQHALAEGQPKLDEALVHLRYALAALNAAPDDKGGHKAKAIELTQKALEQVNQGIAAGGKR
ncbi:hypothetical protein CYFUS_009519 [Cystobacter fuscus]|uniref:Uncharacterized protein n=1 Tax=Cystobacter fuscus TaxID=43 RepID=A0A250JK84_9BACT|nr:hypothetical protein [Cystobacter fuscus]ATB44038.1 hypothetical protein CYFUS_009519 [Cystobacter fuscus]WNG30907.1 hypothetical protein F0U62_48000 [Cystobacter fuscus]